MQNYQQPVMQPATPDVKGKAIGSLICGILSFFCCGVVLGIVAIVLGNQALAVDPNNGMAKAGKIIGIIGLVLTIVMAIISGIAGGTEAMTEMMNSMNY